LEKREEEKDQQLSSTDIFLEKMKEAGLEEEIKQSENS